MGDKKRHNRELMNNKEKDKREGGTFIILKCLHGQTQQNKCFGKLVYMHYPANKVEVSLYIIIIMVLFYNACNQKARRFVHIE